MTKHILPRAKRTTLHFRLVPSHSTLGLELLFNTSKKVYSSTGAYFTQIKIQKKVWTKEKASFGYFQGHNIVQQLPKLRLYKYRFVLSVIVLRDAIQFEWYYNQYF